MDCTLLPAAPYPSAVYCVGRGPFRRHDPAPARRHYPDSVVQRDLVRVQYCPFQCDRLARFYAVGRRRKAQYLRRRSRGETVAGEAGWRRRLAWGRGCLRRRVLLRRSGILLRACWRGQRQRDNYRDREHRENQKRVMFERCCSILFPYIHANRKFERACAISFARAARGRDTDYLVWSRSL